MRKTLAALRGAFILTLAVSPAAAQTPAASVAHAWFRALPSGLPAGGYFTLHNDGAAPLTLTGATSPACGMVMLHRSDTSSGMAEMRDVSTLDVPAGGTIAFAPGGLHLMCMQPGPAMTPGGSVKVTLTFQGGGTLETVFAVRNAAGN